MAITDIALALHWERSVAAKVIAGTRYEHPGQFFRIVGYRWQECSAGREIPIYCADGGEDKKRPRTTKARQAAQKRAHYRRNKARINAKASAKRSAGAAKEVNPWLQLAAPEMRPVMSRIARATGTTA